MDAWRFGIEWTCVFFVGFLLNIYVFNLRIIWATWQLKDGITQYDTLWFLGNGMLLRTQIDVRVSTRSDDVSCVARSTTHCTVAVFHCSLDRFSFFRKAEKLDCVSEMLTIVAMLSVRQNGYIYIIDLTKYDFAMVYECRCRRCSFDRAIAKTKPTPCARRYCGCLRLSCLIIHNLEFSLVYRNRIIWRCWTCTNAGKRTTVRRNGPTSTICTSKL